MLTLYLLAAPSIQLSRQIAETDLAPFIAEAAQKTGLPTALLRAVLRAESNNNPRAVSSKGALGLLQLMPQTWVRLRQQLNLGVDPFDPHDNLIAGAVYLRALYDRYGVSGFLAAYNAGPGRYEAFRDSGHDLPAETNAYVARISENLRTDGLVLTALKIDTAQVRWTAASLFIPAGDDTEPSLQLTQTPESPFVALPGPAPSDTP